MLKNKTFPIWFILLVAEGKFLKFKNFLYSKWMAMEYLHKTFVTSLLRDLHFHLNEGVTKREEFWIGLKSSLWLHIGQYSLHAKYYYFKLELFHFLNKRKCKSFYCYLIWIIPCIWIMFHLQMCLQIQLQNPKT